MDSLIVVRKIDEVLVALAGPVTSEEASDGWTSEAKRFAQTFFERLKKDIETGNALPPMSISRALDHWGVIGGPILELAAEISNDLRR